MSASHRVMPHPAQEGTLVAGLPMPRFERIEVIPLTGACGCEIKGQLTRTGHITLHLGHQEIQIITLLAFMVETDNSRERSEGSREPYEKIEILTSLSYDGGNGQE